MNDITLYRPNQQTKSISIFMFVLGFLMLVLFSLICYTSPSIENLQYVIIFFMSFTSLFWLFSLCLFYHYSTVIAFNREKIQTFKSKSQEYLWCDFSDAYFCPNIHAHEYLVLSEKSLSEKQVHRIVNTSLGVNHSNGLVFYVEKDMRDTLEQTIKDNQVTLHSFPNTF